MTQVGRYQILEELGRGAMGVVYKALDPAIGRTVAIKAIRLSEFQEPDERARVYQRLRREARSAGVLSHPNIVTIYDVIEQDSAAYIVMEFVNGPSLAHLLQRGNLPLRTELLKYLRQVAEALDYAHQKGVVHRDVKPANLIISDDAPDGKSLAKVADFGVAKFISQETTHSGTMIGTPNYLSPEQIETDVADGRSDQFSLAVVIYEVLTGQKPFDSENLSGLFYQICKQNPKPADQINPLLPSATGRALLKGLAKEPEQRFANCSQMVAVLEASLTGNEEQADVSPVVHAGPASRVRRRREEIDPDTTSSKVPWAAAVSVGLLAASLCGGFWIYRTRSRDPVVAAATSLSPASQPSHPATPRLSPPNPRLIPATPQLNFQAPGHSPEPGKTIVVVPEIRQSTELNRTALNVPGDVALRTEPPGATVQLDEQPEVQCTSPCTMRLSSGRHTLMATEPGFETARRIFSVPAESALLVVLERSMGVLLINSEPDGSDVSVDGKLSGKTPLTLHLAAGPHHVVIANRDQRHEETMTVVANELITKILKWR